MPFDSSLGNLSFLPLEIRLEIWGHLSLFPIQCGAGGAASPTSREPRLAFLHTSRRIYNEVSNHLYKDIILRFQVFPEYQYRSWLTVESNSGTRWHLQDLDDAVSRGFGKLPYEKLKGIQVEIGAPCRRDPGQIVCLWKKCLDLVGLLEQADHGVSSLEIYLKDSTLAKWSVDGEPQKSAAVDRVRSDPPRNSITDRSNEQTDILNEDYVIALTAFQRLRNVQRPKVYLPETIVWDDAFACNIESVMVKKGSFGTWLDADDAWDEKSIQDEIDQTFMDLDLELDLLPGITASMMRLERFSSWYTDGLGSESKYERELERITKTWSTSCRNYNEPKHIEFRYEAMRALNPRSLLHQYEVFRRHPSTAHLFTSTEVETIRRAFDLGLMKEEWDRETWHNGYYCGGFGAD
ncbi:hypothetical protein MMC18_000504 [Xylographa bjoerkii]|nr:hypothetical protein [Xylographa bjoerkii]